MNLPSALRSLVVFVAIVLVLYALKLPAQAPAAGTQPARVALFVNGTLGDKSFFDAAARGMKTAHRDLGMTTRVIEAGLDPTRWESALADAAEGADFDVIVTGGFAMVSLVQRLAPLYPAKKFIVFDAAVDYVKCRCDNVHAILFRQNEGAYLAGFLAARAAAAPSLGFVGGMQIPIIEDFFIGFRAGAKAADPRVQVAHQYVNSFTDPATAKEIAKAMYGQGVALIFQAAAGSGQGVIEAAAERRRPTIGVDSDQYALFKGPSPELARFILTSVLKNVDVAIHRALAQHRAGTLKYGTTDSLGLAEGGVSLATGSELLATLAPQVREELAAVQRDIASGAVHVPSAFGKH